MLKSSLKKLFKFKKGSGKSKSQLVFKKEREATSYNPSRDWKKLLIGLAIAVLVIIFCNGIFFLGISNSSKDEKSLELSDQAINRARLDLVLDYYNKKADNFTVLKTEKPVIQDPSR